MPLSRISLALALTLALSACSSSEPPTSAQPGTPAAATDTATEATPTTPASVDSAAVEGPTGVAECDQFLAAYEQCLVDSVPAQARDPMQAGLAQWKQAWKDLAANKTTRDALPQACNQARETSRQSLQTFGCAL